MFDAVLFDADRTIFNNDGLHELVTRKIIEKVGLDGALADKMHKTWDRIYFEEQTKLMEKVGYCIDRENSANSLIIALKEFDINLTYDEADSMFQIMVDEFTERSKPYPDMLALMDFLNEHGIKMGIVSNGDNEVIMNRLKKANIEDQFEFVIAPCEQYPLTKPDLKIFEESLNIIETKADRTIFVGDNPYADVAGANNAGMFSVLIDRWNHYPELEGVEIPDLKISDFNELIEFIREKSLS